VQARDLVGAEPAHAFRRAAEDERAGRHLRSRRDDGAGADQALVADDHAVEEDRADADQAVITDGASVQNGRVADGHILADEGRPAVGGDVHGGVVLDVRARAYADAFDVAAHDRMEPDARVGGEDDVADDDGGVDDEGARVDLGPAFAERRDHGPRS